jgi:hydrogenase expression/formation protein HypE
MAWPCCQQREGTAASTPRIVVRHGQSLHTLVAAMLDAAAPGGVRVLRDPTRGGLATTLNEVAQPVRCGHAAAVKSAIPVLAARCDAACEIAGPGPAVHRQRRQADRGVRARPGRLLPCWPPCTPTRRGAAAACIGSVVDDPNRFVQMTTALGGQRMVDWLSGEQLPRIC